MSMGRFEVKTFSNLDQIQSKRRFFQKAEAFRFQKKKKKNNAKMEPLAWNQWRRWWSLNLSYQYQMMELSLHCYFQAPNWMILRCVGIQKGID